MQLKHLELQGFKSFPDKTVIRFGGGITAIVGPNGSGKSNIADSVRWVMGETSSKQLRGQKMEDVIFDGTALRKPLGFAEVSLVLDNSDQTLSLDFDEVALTRRYYRSGESEYFINRAPARLRDIQDLLRDTGLGKTGYSIIGQGAITEVIAAKSTDRRSIFEEAAGIAKFRYKKEESERKLDRTQDNIIRLNDIIAELAARLPDLEQQSKKAHKYIALRDEKKGLELTLWTDSLKSLDQNLEKTKVDLEAYEADTKRLENELLKNEDESIRTSAEKEKLTAEIEDLRVSKHTLEDRIQQRKADILVRQNDITHAQKDISRIKQSIDDTIKNAQKSDALICECTASIEALLVRISEYNKVQENAENTAEEISKKIKAVTDDTKNAEKEAATARDKLTYLQVRLGSLEQEMESREKLIEGRKKEVEDAKERLQSLQAAGQAAQRKIEEITTKLEENKNIKNGYAVKLNTKNTACKSESEKLMRLQNTLSDKQNRLQILRGMEKHYDGFQNSIRVVMDESKKGVLHGVEGTVSDIIEVPRDYTTAVETALGGAMQNIVTTDERSGKNCISFLKNRGTGRATFLPLDTIRPNKLDVRAVSEEYGFVGLAADLVECGQKYRGVVDFLLGRTVVAEDMDSATSIARKNRYSFRIVTLDGQLVNVGGSLTGGAASRGFGILSRKAEIDELDIMCKGLVKDVSQTEQGLKSLNEELSQINALMSGVDAEIRVCEEQLIKENSDAAHYKTYVENIAEQEALINKELSEFSKTGVKNTEERNIIYVQTEENKNLLEKINEKIEYLHKEAKELSDKSFENAEKIHSIQLEKLEAEKDLETIRLRKDELTATAEHTAEVIEDFNTDISGIEKLIIEYENIINQNEQENANTLSEIDITTRLIQDKMNERMLCEQKIAKMRDSERDLFAAKEKVGRESEKCRLILENASTERDNILTRIWDEYELTLSEAYEERIEIENKEEAQKKVYRIKSEMKALGDVNLAAIDEFVSVKERHDNMNAQVEDLQKAKKQLESIISDLVGQMTEIFKERFKVINEEFNRAFRQLFDGGSAKLELDDPTDVLNSGVEIYVAPPGKIIKSLTALSGGEQSLTAIALYFALLTIRPAPFCLLDEIEAALDDVNVVRYAEYLSRHDKTQFIVITHRRGTMEAANMLYGVTMKEKGISKILAIDVSEIESHI